MKATSFLQLMVAGLLAFGSNPATQAVPPTPVGEYWNQIQQTHEVLDRLAGQDQATIRGALDQEAARWEAVQQVQLDDGTVIPVDHSALTSALRAEPPDIPALKERLTALVEARRSWFPTSSGQSNQTVDTKSSLERLGQILSQPQFDWGQKVETPNPVTEWLNNIWRSILDFLLSFLPREIVVGLDLNSILIAAGLIALVIILFVAVRGMVIDLVAEETLDSRGGLDDQIITAQGALQYARTVSATGDYRTAVRYLYLSTLLFLEERRLLRYDRSRTNREYLHSLVQTPELAALFRDIVDVFDQVWYGFRKLDKDSFDHYADRVGEIQRLR